MALISVATLLIILLLAQTIVHFKGHSQRTQIKAHSILIMHKIKSTRTSPNNLVTWSYKTV